MYMIAAIVLFISSFFIGGGFKFVAMAAAAGLFAIADSIVSVANQMKNRKK